MSLQISPAEGEYLFSHPRSGSDQDAGGLLHGIPIFYEILWAFVDRFQSAIRKLMRNDWMFWLKSLLLMPFMDLFSMSFLKKLL